MTGNPSAEEKMPASYQDFLKNLEEKRSPEDKVEVVLAFMRDTLAQKGVPHFRDFWESRKLFHPLLKECTNPLFKSKAWKDFSSMTVEARRLKEILDEQSAFSVEQIELALKAVEADLSEAVRGREKVEFPKNLHALSKRTDEYEKMQEEINFFGSLSARLRDLRKEIIDTDMRIRQKNQLLKKISVLGDDFIPKRRTLVEKLSAMFVEDVQHFEMRHFKAESKVSVRNLREEIKALQAVSKELSLSSKAFHASREVLSRCWETLSERGEEERSQWKEAKEQAGEWLKELEPKIEAFAKSVDSGSLSRAQAQRERDALIEQIRKGKLVKKIEMGLLRKVNSITDAAMAKALKRQQEEVEQQKAEIETRRQRYLDAVRSDKSLEELQALLEEFRADPCDELLDEALQFAILQKEELKAEEGEFGDIFEKLDGLRVQLRKKVDRFRKAAGGSNLDFEAAIMTSERLERAKALLDNIEKALGEYE